MPSLVADAGFSLPFGRMLAAIMPSLVADAVHIVEEILREEILSNVEIVSNVAETAETAETALVLPARKTCSQLSTGNSEGATGAPRSKL